MPTTLYIAEGSPPCRATLLLMEYLKITNVELKNINTMGGEQFDPEFLKKNPQHTVPFLDDNGFHLSESRAINFYLVDSRAPESGLLGRFPKRRALIHQRLHFELGSLSTQSFALFGPLFFGKTTTFPEEPLKKVREHLAITETYLSKSAYIAGDDITIADFSYLPWIAIYNSFGLPRDKYPNILAWYKRCSSLPGMEEAETVFRGMASTLKEKLTEVADF